MRAIIILTLAGLVTSLPVSGVQADPLITPAAGNSGVYNPPPAKKGFKYPDCFCTDSVGKRVELGQTSCLRIGSQQVLARCDMSLNNPAWRRISEGCPSV